MNGPPGLVVVQSILDSLRCAMGLLISMKLGTLCMHASFDLHLSEPAKCDFSEYLSVATTFQALRQIDKVAVLRKLKLVTVLLSAGLYVGHDNIICES